LVGTFFYQIVWSAVFSVVEPHHFGTDADSTHHPDVDPDSDFYLMRSGADQVQDPSCEIKPQSLEKVLK
jgi:hypothetical protein